MLRYIVIKSSGKKIKIVWLLVDHQSMLKLKLKDEFEVQIWSLKLELEIWNWIITLNIESNPFSLRLTFKV